MAEEEGSLTPDTLGPATYTSLLQHTYDEALIKNELSTNYWIKIKEEYKTLQSHLEVLPNDVSKEVMVPVGPKALMKGKMVHTNEILVCLGDGWFVKQSAKQAVDICKRRLQMCDEMLTKLENERSLLTSRKELPFAEEAFGNTEGKEILEPYDEEKEAEWRVQHRQKEREYRKKLAELRKKEKIEVKTEEDLWRKLDDLELQEELEEELDRLHASDSEEEDYEEQETDEDYEDETASIDTPPNRLLLKENSDITSRLNSEHLIEDCTAAKNNFEVDENIKSVTRRVSFKKDPIIEHDSCFDSDAEDPLRIEFKHSSFSPVKPEKQSKENEIENPADIYDHYAKNCMQPSAPKSILKQTHSSSDVSKKMAWHNELDSMPVENNGIYNITETGMKHELPVAVQIDVVEHDCSTDASTDSCFQTARPVSKFRAARSRKK